jgi:predicted acetyltransferase
VERHGHENSASVPATTVEVSMAGPEHEPILANLLELYIHDFSEFVHTELGDNGRFGYPYLPLYWSEPHRYPFLIRAEGKLAGFALAKRGSEVSHKKDVWEMAEFFVIRGYRKRNVGTRAAHQVWRKCPGPWEIRVLPSNIAAKDFWSHAIAEFVGHDVVSVSVDIASTRWLLFSFESPVVA